MTFSLFNEQRLVSGQTSLSAFMASPSVVLDAFILEGNLIFSETLVTLARAATGFIIGVILAFVVAFIFFFSPVARILLYPLTVAINAFPIVGFAPVIILIFGQNSFLSIVFVSVLISYFPTLVCLDASASRLKKEYIDLSKVLNLSRFQMYRKIIFPSSLPVLVVTAKLSIPASIIGAMLGEWLGSRQGIGHLIIISMYQLKPGILYASLISVALVSLVFVIIIERVYPLLFPWLKDDLSND